MNLPKVNISRAYWGAFIVLSLLSLLGIRYFQPEALILSIFAEAIIFMYALLPTDLANFKARIDLQSSPLRPLLKDALKILDRAVISPLAFLMILFLFLWLKVMSFGLADFAIILVLGALSIPLPKDPRFAQNVSYEVYIILCMSFFAYYGLAGDFSKAAPGLCFLILFVPAILTAFLYGTTRLETMGKRGLLISAAISLSLCILAFLTPANAPALIVAFIALCRFLALDMFSRTPE